jgi:actin-like ATPase involved in cell morphogenesis
LRPLDSAVAASIGAPRAPAFGDAISDALGIPVRIADDPLTAVARGTGVFLEKLDVFASVLSADEEG